MHSDASLANQIFQRMALSKDDVLAIRTVDLVIEQLQQSAMFFKARLEEGDFFAEQSIDVARELAEKSDILAHQLSQDYMAKIEFDGDLVAAYLAASKHMERLARVLRELNLNPEWKEYYDDIARKLNEYANGLRIDPESSFRAI